MLDGVGVLGVREHQVESGNVFFLLTFSFYGIHTRYVIITFGFLSDIKLGCDHSLKCPSTG
jgi:hypothetical protein